ncbi:hypothetical protein [Umezawaea beigongshangensis]|uniref:hypothetical protein n=1 Tax=Umezawaea beigongshangensis TaxID=2780383 RepID=UPI0018F2526A|nr:hypothetical protein [Umezawaea beigongshangensis]
MPRKPSPRPETELTTVREYAEELAQLERAVAQARSRRNRAMVMAKAAGATGDHLAEAAGIARRNVTEILRAAGDPNDPHLG